MYGLSLDDRFYNLNVSSSEWNFYSNFGDRRSWSTFTSMSTSSSLFKWNLYLYFEEVDLHLRHFVRVKLLIVFRRWRKSTDVHILLLWVKLSFSASFDHPLTLHKYCFTFVFLFLEKSRCPSLFLNFFFFMLVLFCTENFL